MKGILLIPFALIYILSASVSVEARPLCVVKSNLKTIWYYVAKDGTRVWQCTKRKSTGRTSEGYSQKSLSAVKSLCKKNGKVFTRPVSCP